MLIRLTPTVKEHPPHIVLSCDISLEEDPIPEARKERKNTMDPKQKLPGLYDPRFEHDNCGIGAVANIKGIKTHKTVDQALHIVEHLEHRAGKDAEGKTG